MKGYLALANVPMWHYGFLPILPLLRLIHNSLSSLSWTITTCRHYLLALVVLASITKKGEIVRKMDPWPIYFGFWCLIFNTTKASK